ncbi:flavodoxin family protein [Oscillospiraceae bacterium PP1C4]
MKILAILASPRRDGKLSKMLSVTSEAAKAAGHEVETVNLYAQNIGYCTGCMQCRKDGVCVLKDDLAAIRESLLHCDVVVMAAPTYFANVPAAAKNLFDRLSGAIMDENSIGIPKGRLSKQQKYLLLTACTTFAPFDWLCGQSSGVLRAMREVFKTAGMTQLGTVVFAGSKGKQEIPAHIQNRLKKYWN